MKNLTRLSASFPRNNFLFMGHPEGSSFVEKHYEQIQGGLMEDDAHSHLSPLQNEKIYKKVQEIEEKTKNLSPDEKALLGNLMTQVIEGALSQHLDDDTKSIAGLQVGDFLNGLDAGVNRILDTGLDNTANSFVEIYKNNIGSPDSWDWKIFENLAKINTKYGGDNYNAGDWWKINGEIADAFGADVPEDRRSFFGKAFQSVTSSGTDGMVGKGTLAAFFSPDNQQMRPLLAKAQKERADASPTVAQLKTPVPSEETYTIPEREVQDIAMTTNGEKQFSEKKLARIEKRTKRKDKRMAKRETSPQPTEDANFDQLADLGDIDKYI